MHINVVKSGLIALCSSALLMALIGSSASTSKEQPRKMQGVCWVSGDSIAGHNIDELTANNVNWISQTMFGYQPAYNRPEIQFGGSGWNWGERDFGICHTTRLAHERGIKVVIKPHLWLRRSEGKWRSDIAMQNDADWEAWFCNYTDFILHYARLAQACNAEVLCIGTELLVPATKFPDKWRKLIGQVREIYDGDLTYAANFYREFEEITWWDAVDYIGIQGYFPLCKSEVPTVQQLKKGWQPHLKKMQAVSEQFGRPVIFTEIGYRNDQKAASEPWLWPRQIDDQTVAVDNDIQARCYQAFFETCWKQDWFAGTFFWKWFHGSWKHPDYSTYLGERYRVQDSLARLGENSRNYRKRFIRFTPQGREAQDVMRAYYGGS